ncbi:serine-protein kinase ATM isoform X6 [Tamandua tetradactyla]|uniref:serine-protein kinase ATM isoform X6 n=1 Tax=Tamandua tetradactyla TaxID=48850 RepID=UPI004053F93D
MSLALNDLLICCRQLEHDRATERKKEVEKFKRLIRDPETVQHLDRHSDSKQGKYLNWDAVFRFLQKYIQKETECLRTAKSNVSASTQASRQKKMQEISSLVKYFIKCANKRAPRLKCQELLNYIMDTVKDSSNGAIYGADCSNILLKDILSVRKYWCEISQQQWLVHCPEIEPRSTAWQVRILSFILGVELKIFVFSFFLISMARGLSVLLTFKKNTAFDFIDFLCFFCFKIY